MEPAADKLLCYEHEGKHFGLPFLPGECIHLGSDPECEVLVTGHGIAPRHGRLEYQANGQVRVTALGEEPLFPGADQTPNQLLRPPFDLKAGPFLLSFVLVPWEQVMPTASPGVKDTPGASAPGQEPATREKKKSQPTLLKSAPPAEPAWLPPPLPPRVKPQRQGLFQAQPGVFAASAVVSAVFWWGLYSLEIRHPQLARHEFMRQQATSQLEEIKGEKERMARILETAKTDLETAQNRLGTAEQTAKIALNELADTQKKYAPAPPAKDKPMAYLDVRGWLVGQGQATPPSLAGLTATMVSEELIVSLIEQGGRQIESGQLAKGITWMQLAREAAAMKNDDTAKLRTAALTGLARLVNNQATEAVEALEAAFAKLQQPRAQPQLAGVLHLALADARLRLKKPLEAAQSAEEARVYAVGQGHALREATASLILAKIQREQGKPHLAHEHYQTAARALRNHGDWEGVRIVDDLATQADREAMQMRETDGQSKQLVELEQFIREAVQVENLQDINGIMRNYAQVVDYFDKGNIYRGTVEEDKLSYFSRYPHAVHTFISPIQLREQPNGTVQAEFTTTYHLINTQGESKRGSTRQFLTLERQFFRWVIVRQRAESTPDSQRQSTPAAVPESKPSPRIPPTPGNSSSDSLRERARRFNDL